MDSGEMMISATAVTGFLVFLIYTTAVIATYRQLFSRLSPTAVYLLVLSLVAYSLVLVGHFLISPTWSFGHWLFHVDLEWNLPSALTSMLFSLVGSVALITAWLHFSKRDGHWHYFLVIGLVFLLLALDDFTGVFRSGALAVTNVLNWNISYYLIGASTVLLTIRAAIRSSRREWSFHMCLLVGVALLGAAGLVIDAYELDCVNPGFLRLDGCLKKVVLEESIEFLGTWLALVAMLGHFTEVSPSPMPRVRRALFLIPPLWIILLIPITPIPSIARQSRSEPAAVVFESGIALHAYRIGRAERSVNTHLMLSPTGWNFDNLGYSIHIVDQVHGDSVASKEKVLSRRLGLLMGPGYVPAFRNWAKVVIPPETRANRAFWIVLSLWREEGGDFVRQTIVTSDLTLLSGTQVVLGEIVFASTPSEPDVMATFDNGFILQSFELPARTQAGATLEISFTWQSDVAGTEDHVQFLHLGHEESGEWWVYDQQPLGARLPTRLWYSGLVDSEVWQVPLPADLAPGRYHVFTGLYRISDQERVPASDAEGTPFVDARVPLGAFIMQ